MAKTVRNLLTSVRSNLSELKGLRYVSGAATSDGNANGLTLVDSGLSAYKADHFVGCIVKLATDHRRPLVSDFDPSTGILTVGDGSTPSTGFGVRASSGVTYEILEKGIFDDAQLIEWANQAQIELLSLLSDDALVTVAKNTTTTGEDGESDLPDDFIRLISLSISDSGTTASESHVVRAGEVVAGSGVHVGDTITTVTADADTTYSILPLLHPDEKWRFDHDPFLDDNNPAAVFEGNVLKYHPVEDSIIVWDYIGKLDDISTSQSFEWPDDYFGILCDLTTAKAFQASEDFNSAVIYRRSALEMVTARNAQVDDTMLFKMTNNFRSDTLRKAA
jgi:hypothetical protein